MKIIGTFSGHVLWQARNFWLSWYSDPVGQRLLVSYCHADAVTHRFCEKTSLNCDFSNFQIGVYSSIRNVHMQFCCNFRIKITQFSEVILWINLKFENAAGHSRSLRGTLGQVEASRKVCAEIPSISSSCLKYLRPLRHTRYFLYARCIISGNWSAPPAFIRVSLSVPLRLERWGYFLGYFVDQNWGAAIWRKQKIIMHSQYSLS